MKNFFKLSDKDDDTKKPKKIADSSDKVDKKNKKDVEIFFETEPKDWDQVVVLNEPYNTDISPKTVKPKNSVVDVDKVDTKKPQTTFVYKPIITDRKLSIILIENTTVVAKENDKLLKIIKKLVPTGFVSIIRYGEDIKKSEISEMFKLKDEELQCTEDAGNSACLSDALVILDKLVTEEYMVVKEEKYKSTRINTIDIIGIGTCKDDCSKNPRSVGINCFCNIAKKPNIVTKYFCLTEDSFVDAAEIGFRSIGAINMNYYNRLE